MPLLQKLVSTLTIPDISGKTGTPIGDIEYSITHIQISQVQVATPVVTLVSADRLQVSLSQLHAHFNLNWHYREHAWPHISDSGSADANVDLRFDLVAALDIDLSQKCAIRFSIPSFNPKITHFSLNLHGGASWLYNVCY